MAKIPTGRFVWFEYTSKDAPRAQRFYGELFGWKTKEIPTPQSPYTMIAIGDETIGGYWPTPPGAPPNGHWISHLQVESAVDSAAKVKSLGGQVKMEPMKVGDFGTFAVVQDPMGAVFSLWQPGTVKTHDDYLGKPGTWCWNELHTPDPAKALTFYKALGGFEVETQEMGEHGQYHMLKSDGKGRAGIMKQSMQGVPSMWLPYVQVDNADRVAERATKLGASVKVPPTDIPEVGRFALLIDPLGGAIGIIKTSS